MPRIVVASALRADREMLASALEVHRPTYEVLLGDPGDLDSTLAETKPDVVIATTSSATLDSFAGVVMLVTPAEREQLVVHRAGHGVRTIEDAGLSDLMSLIDELGNRTPDSNRTSTPDLP